MRGGRARWYNDLTFQLLSGVYAGIIYCSSFVLRILVCLKVVPEQVASLQQKRAKRMMESPNILSTWIRKRMTYYWCFIFGFAIGAVVLCREYVLCQKHVPGAEEGAASRVTPVCAYLNVWNQLLSLWVKSVSKLKTPVALYSFVNSIFCELRSQGAPPNQCVRPLLVSPRGFRLLWGSPPQTRSPTANCKLHLYWFLLRNLPNLSTSNEPFSRQRDCWWKQSESLRSALPACLSKTFVTFKICKILIFEISGKFLKSLEITNFPQIWHKCLGNKWETQETDKPKNLFTRCAWSFGSPGKISSGSRPFQKGQTEVTNLYHFFEKFAKSALKII